MRVLCGKRNPSKRPSGETFTGITSEILSPINTVDVALNHDQNIVIIVPAVPNLGQTDTITGFSFPQEATCDNFCTRLLP